MGFEGCGMIDGSHNMVTSDSQTSSAQRYWDVVRKVDEWIERHSHAGNDPYDVLGSPLLVYLRSSRLDPVSVVASKVTTQSSFRKNVKTLLVPVYQSASFMRLLRLVLGVRKTINPKSMGLLVQGYVRLHRLGREEKYLKKIDYSLRWLMDHTNQDFGKYCWGIPYVWQMVNPNCRIPKGGPQSTLTAVNGLGFLEAFELTGREQYLDVAKSCCDFFLENLNIDRVSDKQIAFSYTPYDRTHVLNVNLHCGALLSRVWKHTRTERYLDACMKATQFTVAHQREDGAWHYSSHLDGFINAVDNYHTGDNLEYLDAIRSSVPEFPFEQSMKKGLDYYLAHFFLESGFPKYTDELLLPVDIHSCAQSIITLATLSDYDERSASVARKVAGWTLDNMFHPEGHFYYRMYKAGSYDKSDYIGWGDAWMVKAFALLLANEAKKDRVAITSTREGGKGL
jgi:hypothetical protein